MTGKFISAPAAILVIVLFFLPWVTISCEGATIGEFSGYELAAGVETSGDNPLVGSDTLESDPILYGIPLTAVIALILLAIALGKPTFQLNAGWGIVIAAIVGLLIPVLKWLQLQNNSSSFDIVVQPAMWGTLVALLAMGAGGVVQLLRPSPIPSQQPTGGLAPPPTPPGAQQWTPPAQQPVRPQPQSRRPADPTLIEGDENDPNATILEDDYIFDNAAATGDPNATIVGDDYDAGPARPNVNADQGSVPASGESVKHDRFKFPDSAISFDDPAEKPPELRPQKPATPSTPSSAAEPPAATPPGGSSGTPKTEVLNLGAEMMAWLVVGSGTRKGEQIRLLRDTTIGRDPANDIVIDETAMSGLHARIKLENGRFVIYDQQSTNGLFLYDGERERWEPKTQAELQDGSRIKLGRTVFYLMTLQLNE